MADVKAANAALGRIEGILRRRYHYPHPIFEHVAAARAALEATAPKAKVAEVPAKEAGVEAAMQVAGVSAEEDSEATGNTTAPPEPARPTQRKRGSA